MPANASHRLTPSEALKRPFGIQSILSVLTFPQLKTAIEEGSVGEHGYRSISCAESQAAPESKGEALGQWQHGSGEATSMLVSFTGTGCHVDSEPRLLLSAVVGG